MKDLVKGRYLLKVESLLDYGCGHGRDLSYARRHVPIVVGFDPHPAFGFSNPPWGTFDAVTMIYVVNVLHDVDDRESALLSAWRYVKPGGFLFVASRTEGEVRSLANKHGWDSYGDGYVTPKKTFQRGFNPVQLLLFAEKLPAIKRGLCEWCFVESGRYAGVLLAKRRWS